MTELSKAYEAQVTDSKWYKFWLEHNFFHADPHSSKPPFSIVMPPPNVTGVLHMGHALVTTLQDILVRWKRMSGFETLWVPGTDHAGIATQTVVERHLIKTTGKRRKDFDREEFVSLIWSWKEENEDQILTQLKRLGSSCDWGRLRFTMDQQNNRAVKTMFKKLFDEGLIYRGDYLVNWDPVTQTALADDEVEYEDRQSFLWFFKYPLKNGSGFVHIATTRPETMLGDTAIAVSPHDSRYKHLVGQLVAHPMTQREIPIIADHFVDPEFGTGMVKITPSHDPNDYQMGLNHNLPFVNMMTPDGKVNANGGRFEGMTMADARTAIVEEMKQRGFLEKIEPHINRVGVSYRSKATIEPYMSKQWFVRMGQFAKVLREAVAEKQVSLIPSNWESTYYHWINNLRDWCISRQLWWGHRIPIWYHRNNPNRMICYAGDDIPPEVAAAPDEWFQDEDVLDTWFSSGLWPFSTLGWPDQTEDLKTFYPNSVLVTGHDILFFWVARMIFMGEHALKKPPFPTVFLHGLIYGKSYWRNAPGGGVTYLSSEERAAYDLGKPMPADVQSKWEKMSKSKGNIIDPIEMIETYGTDAVRMALCSSATQAREIDLDRRRFEEFKNFANKVWNGARFVMMNLEGDSAQGTTPLTAEEFSQGLDETLLALEDRWILSTLNHIVDDVNGKLAAYAFDQAALNAYDFFWKEFCAYYVEIAKPVLFGKQGTPAERKNKQKLLAIILCMSVRLLHPMAPYITEELFQKLKERLAGSKVTGKADPYTTEANEALSSTACIVAPYPKVIRQADRNEEIEKTFESVGNVIYTIRNIRGEMKLPPSAATDVYIVGREGDMEFEMIKNNLSIIKALVRINLIKATTAEPSLGLNATGVYHSLKIVIPIPVEMVAQEKARLLKEKDRLAMSLEKTQKQLANTEYVSKAPQQLIDKQKASLQQMESELSALLLKLEQIG